VKSWALAGIGSLLIAGTALAEDGLAELIQAGDRAAALAMIEGGADVNAAQSNGTTPLHWAAYKGDEELVAALIENGAKADVANAYGSSPLTEAANVADAEIVAMLLEAGANPNSANAEGQTALMVAARTGDVDLARVLVRHGADVDARESWRGQTALMWAVAQNLPEMADFLIASGADVNVRTLANDWDRQVTNEPRAQYRPTGGLSTLQYAVRGGCMACVRAILERGADINAPNPDGVTPLMVAIDNYRFDIAAQLIDEGANIDVWDWWGRTALYVAIDVNTYLGGSGFGSAPPPMEIDDTLNALDIARRLLEAGADPNVQLVLHRPDRAGAGRFVDDPLRTGATPLLRAAMDGDVAAIGLLLEHGADVDLPNVMGVTPFMAAAGMAVSSRDMRGGYRTLDHERLEPRAIAAMEALHEAGADVNARVTDTQSWTARIARLNTMTDRDGQTAIYATAGWGWTDAVSWLIDHGAALDIVDALGKSPLDAARGDAGGRPERIRPETAAAIEEALGRS
jgi:ankyrin repeat protein